MVFSKTREGAKVFSREANYLEFETDNKDLSVGNKAPYGSPSLKQTQHDIWYPTVQAAIDDVRSLSPTFLGEIKMTIGTDPNPVKQQTRMTITGVCNLGSDVEEQYLDILGFKIKMVSGDDGNTTAAKWKAAADGYAAAGIAIDKIQIAGSSQNIVEITHLDYQNHSFEDFRWNGISVSFGIISPPQMGYGSWLNLGTEDKTIGLNTYKVTYWQRMS